MNDNRDFIRASIIRDMSEGVMVIGLDGVITDVNPAALRILCKEETDLAGKRFARCFFEYEENDAFNQTVLDAVYDTSVSHENIVPYFTGETTRQLHVTTSYLREGEQKIGVIAVLSDISELTELRDAVKAMERIKALNGQLELRNKLLSETFGRFLSDEIVRQLLDTPDGLALGGKKAELTVMMSDLRGFTALSERMPAQDLLTMLNHYLGEMTEVIQGRGGTIIEFIGDGIMAIFGAPAPSAIHAEQAVVAAVEMQARMPAINRWNEEHGFPTLEMGIGVHTGDMIVGNIGSEKRTKYGVTGANVNLAGRIESYTVGGQVLVSPTTRAQILAPLTVRSEAEVMPKGVHKPITLSEVVGVGAPYSVSCGQATEPPVPLKTPVEVTFFPIREKHTEKQGETGSFVALSRDEAVLRTDAALAVYENLQIPIGESENLFCKVVAKSGADWLLRFTAKPASFDIWLDQQT